MYLALIVLPILGSIVSGFFGRKVGVSGSQLITCTCVIITTFLAVMAFIEVGLNNIPVTIYLFRWIDSETLNISWGFNFDSLTVSMLIPVLVVSSLVHVYSIGYMSHDPHNQRFFSYLSLFTFMMITLVTANNFLLMFVGWEGVGICSYLLVSFWFTRIAANQSSMSAFLTNRVGDCFLTIGMFAILWSFGNIDYYTVFSLSPFLNENVITIIGICLLIGAMAKSSQVGLHVWLPMAMEGPTPVSALIHAATMVTAGVYLLMRTSPLIEYSSTVLILCLWVGAITTVFSSLIGLFQQDIKKVIAYSTMSQLGMMVIAVGLSSYNIALFHLVNHAFYKGLLFLGAGAVIHAVADNQDFRKYGGLIAYLPLTYTVMLIASLSLVAIPFMTGFYSKDFILESAYGQYHLSSIIVYFIATIGAMFTTLYSVKVLYLTFLTNPNGPLVNYKQGHSAHDGDIYMSIPLIILAIFSIFFGYLTKDIFLGLGSGFFSDNGLFIHPSHEIMLDTEFAVPFLFKLLPFFFTISLSLLSIIFTEFYPKLLIKFKLSNIGYNIFSFFNQRFLIELFYNKYISDIILKLGGQTTKVMDKGSIELFGPYGLEKRLTNLSKSIGNLSTGVVTSYALYILIGLIFYISILYYGKTSDNYLELLLILFAFVNINYNFKDFYTINRKPASINYVTWIIPVLFLKIKTVYPLISLFLITVLYILATILKHIYEISILLPFFTFTVYLFIKCYINVKQDETFSYSLSIKVKVKTYINLSKYFLGVLFRDLNNIIGYIVILIITIMLLCINNVLLIYYFDLPIDIVWFKWYFKFSMLGPYMYFSIFITQIYLYYSNKSILNYNIFTNNLFHKFSIQRLFFFIGLGFLGIYLPNLIVDIPITYYDGLLVTYSYQDYINSGYKYRFIRTWIDESKVFKYNDPSCTTPGYPYATTCGSLNSYIDMKIVNDQLPFAANLQEIDRLNNLSYQHISKVHQYSSVRGIIPDISNNGAYMVVTDPQGNTVYNKGTFLYYSTEGAVLGFSVFISGGQNIPFNYGGINFASSFIIPTNLPVIKAT
jgi:NADH-ubiquinone oxidoreductase chain 5